MALIFGCEYRRSNFAQNLKHATSPTVTMSTMSSALRIIIYSGVWLAQVGVGIVITHNPLHGSGQAAFPHPALALGDDAHAAQGIGMTDRSDIAVAPR
jgi:hypothetical protein